MKWIFNKIPTTSPEPYSNYFKNNGNNIVRQCRKVVCVMPSKSTTTKQKYTSKKKPKRNRKKLKENWIKQVIIGMIIYSNNYGKLLNMYIQGFLMLKIDLNSCHNRSYLKNQPTSDSLSLAFSDETFQCNGIYWEGEWENHKNKENIE